MTERRTRENRLAREKSPYLLSHAQNPVDWFPWGEEAWLLARETDRPIFLSIGYATCHWCHVMEKESFQDSEVAEALNETFVSVKVDKEELPEIDNLYMEFARSMISGAAGWPLNLILTPSLKPFFAATYLRANGLVELARRIGEVWGGEERGFVEDRAERITRALSEAPWEGATAPLPPKEALANGLEQFLKMSDPVYGGLRGAPKFPIGYHINLFLELSERFKESRALFLAERTLVMARRGGIFDHLGGGFSRYSVDEKWMAPHFEKMLYDNAFLVESYFLMWQVTGRDFYRETSQEILEYILRKLTFFQGGFFCAEDADSEGQEGIFYTWTVEEIDNVLIDYFPELFREFHNVTEEGNFEGRNILRVSQSVEEFALSKGMSPVEFEKILSRQKKMLWDAREKRTRPLKDDKIVTSWNGLMIRSFALTGAAYGEQRYLDAALTAAEFIRDYLWKEKILYRRYRDEDARFAGGLDDYAFLTRGLITLFEVGLGVEWLEWAIELSQILDRDFRAPSGGYFQADGKDPLLILRKRYHADGAEPSGNAVQAENCLRLYQITGDTLYKERAEGVFQAAKTQIESYPIGYSYHLLGLSRYYSKTLPTVVVCLNANRDGFAGLRQALYSSYSPKRSVIWKESGDHRLDTLIPDRASQRAIEGKTTVYLGDLSRHERTFLDWTEAERFFRERD